MCALAACRRHCVLMLVLMCVMLLSHHVDAYPSNTSTKTLSLTQSPLSVSSYFTTTLTLTPSAVRSMTPTDDKASVSITKSITSSVSHTMSQEKTRSISRTYTAVSTPSSTHTYPTSTESGPTRTSSGGTRSVTGTSTPTASMGSPSVTATPSPTISTEGSATQTLSPHTKSPTSDTENTHTPSSTRVIFHTYTKTAGTNSITALDNTRTHSPWTLDVATPSVTKSKGTSTRSGGLSLTPEVESPSPSVSNTKNTPSLTITRAPTRSATSTQSPTISNYGLETPEGSFTASRNSLTRGRLSVSASTSDEPTDDPSASLSRRTRTGSVTSTASSSMCRRRRVSSSPDAIHVEDISGRGDFADRHIHRKLTLFLECDEWISDTQKIASVLRANITVTYGTSVRFVVMSNDFRGLKSRRDSVLPDASGITRLPGGVLHLQLKADSLYDIVADEVWHFAIPAALVESRSPPPETLSLRIIGPNDANAMYKFLQAAWLFDDAVLLTAAVLGLVFPPVDPTAVSLLPLTSQTHCAGAMDVGVFGDMARVALPMGSVDPSANRMIATVLFNMAVPGVLYIVLRVLVRLMMSVTPAYTKRFDLAGEAARFPYLPLYAWWVTVPGTFFYSFMLLIRQSAPAGIVVGIIAVIVNVALVGLFSWWHYSLNTFEWKPYDKEKTYAPTSIPTMLFHRGAWGPRSLAGQLGIFIWEHRPERSTDVMVGTAFSFVFTALMAIVPDTHCGVNYIVLFVMLLAMSVYHVFYLPFRNNIYNGLTALLYILMALYMLMNAVIWLGGERVRSTLVGRDTIVMLLIVMFLLRTLFIAALSIYESIGGHYTMLWPKEDEDDDDSAVAFNFESQFFNILQKGQRAVRDADEVVHAENEPEIGVPLGKPMGGRRRNSGPTLIEMVPTSSSGGGGGALGRLAAPMLEHVAPRKARHEFVVIDSNNSNNNDDDNDKEEEDRMFSAMARASFGIHPALRQSDHAQRYRKVTVGSSAKTTNLKACFSSRPVAAAADNGRTNSNATPRRNVRPPPALLRHAGGWGFGTTPAAAAEAVGGVDDHYRPLDDVDVSSPEQQPQHRSAPSASPSPARSYQSYNFPR